MATVTADRFGRGAAGARELADRRMGTRDPGADERGESACSDRRARAGRSCASVALAGWGIVELRKERVNLGVAAFVITVGSFYFN